VNQLSSPSGGRHKAKRAVAIVWGKAQLGSATIATMALGTSPPLSQATDLTAFTDGLTDMILDLAFLN
jgi:hypothetical protein